MTSSERFDEYADTYRATVQDSISFLGQEHEYFTRRKVEHLLELVARSVGDPAATSFLDVGCGIGTTDALLAPHVGALHGVDTATAAIERAAAANSDVAYRAYDGKRLPFDDGGFDVVFAICVVHHVDLADRLPFVGELARVVRPGGVVAVFEHNPYNPLTRKAVRDCEFDEGVVLTSRRDLARLLTRAGLRPIAARYIIFSPIDKPFVPRLERPLGWLPAGAQHYVAARR